MSRAYRIQVKESVTKVVRAEDHVSCQLELLEILPCEQTADLLGAELEKLGFVREGDIARRKTGVITVTVELASGLVTVSAEETEKVQLEGTKEGITYTDTGPVKHAEKALSDALLKELQVKADEKREDLQKQVTDALESKLHDVRVELEGAVNRITAEALKLRAAQLGQIKTITEDPASGSMTIVVEV
ncbi:MAG: hypothetical protein SFV81_19450 [Pirellulaceae bacterium]|nr:hypothetical protein [Pirellulaceae bacterium]